MSESVAGFLGLVGFFLIGLAGVAGVVLVIKATTAKTQEVHGTSTLWGVFIIGLVAGIWLLVSLGTRK